MTTLFRCIPSVVLTLLLVGCSASTAHGYKIVSFSEDPAVSSGVNPNLGHKFILIHNGVLITAHCWIGEYQSVDTSCLELQSKVGQTVVLQYLDSYDTDVLVYHTKNRGLESEEMLRIASASVK